MSFLKTDTDSNGRKRHVWMIGGPASQMVPRRRWLENGRRRQERITAKPFRRMVNANGNVVQIDLTNGAADRNIGSSYARDRWARKLAAGFVPTDECAVANRCMPLDLLQEMPEGQRGPCKGWVDDHSLPKRMPRDVEPCVHVKAIIAERHARAVTDRDKFRRSIETDAAKQARIQTQILQNIERQTSARSEPRQERRK